ncbi:MAG: dicarboxylate/amino acid:cation symporter [Gammaproteobacteria bacterium]|nr:dicarboxylate/amino acid:cation symporter [Gammaproteobacteria bacterium]
MLKLKLHWQIIIALVLAVVAGSLSGKDAAVFGLRFYQVYDFIGTLFMNALKMLIVPLIMSSIISGVARLGGGSLGRLGGKTLTYYAATSLIAILIGLSMVNLIEPGIVDGEPAHELIGLNQAADEVVSRVEGRGIADVVDVFLRMVPVNIVDAAAQGQMLGLIFFSLLFGYFMTRVTKEHHGVLATFWEAIFAVMMKITEWVMSFAPLGVFALVAKVVAVTGLAAIKPLLLFFLTTLGALFVHFAIALPLILLFVARVNPLPHYQAMAPALLTAFSTASSSSTLPITMDCVEKRAGVSNRTSSFVLPLGATVNMDGTALYECVAALFLAQAYGLDLGFAEQFSIVLIALLTSIGVAGIPAASLVAITIILTSIGLPAEAVGIILAVDRVLDMCRTSVNVFSDSCGAVVVGKLEGEQDILKR